MTFDHSVPVQTIPPIDPLPTLLIVDDQPSVLVSLQFVLSGTYRVLSAGSGSQALELAAEHVIDGAIVDLHMPAMNGLETSERLQAKGRETGRSLRVWLMSAAAPTEMRRRALEAGALGFFEKPFPEDLLEQVARGFSAEPDAVPSPASSMPFRPADAARNLPVSGPMGFTSPLGIPRGGSPWPPAAGPIER